MFGGGGQQFVFNMGGGPGFRVHQFGGGRPRRRPREATNTQEETQQSLLSLITNLLPLLILVILPLLSSLLSSGDSTPSGPEVRYKSEPPYTMLRTTPRYKFSYYINPEEVVDFTNRQFYKLDERVANHRISTLQYECQGEIQGRNRMLQEAQGWFFPDTEKMNQARRLELRSCKKLQKLGVPLNNY